MTALLFLLVAGGVLLVWSGVTDTNIAQAITSTLAPAK